MLRALYVALRSDGAALANDHLYVGDEWVARVNRDHVELRGVTAFNGHRDVWTHQPYRVTDHSVPAVLALIDERRAARAKSLPEPEAGPSREPGEASCAA